MRIGNHAAMHLSMRLIMHLVGVRYLVGSCGVVRASTDDGHCVTSPLPYPAPDLAHAPRPLPYTSLTYTTLPYRPSGPRSTPYSCRSTRTG